MITNFETLPPLDKLKQDAISLVRPAPKSVFGIHDPLALRYLFQLRLGLSPLRSHKKRYNFADTPSDECLCREGPEDTRHFFLFCPFYEIHRTALINDVNQVLSDCSINFDGDLLTLFLYGHHSVNNSKNKKILTATINYIRSTNRFS